MAFTERIKFLPTVALAMPNELNVKLELHSNCLFGQLYIKLSIIGESDPGPFRDHSSTPRDLHDPWHGLTDDASS